ncbi:MAG: hypothetical protein QG597_3321 [Actinomycetota bacterium]|nr:hypothetical protein [Actinomycetota bacterium]
MADSTPDLGRFNVVVVGRPGCGGATLVRAVFGTEAVATGRSRTVASGVEYYAHPDGMLGVYRLVECELQQEEAGAPAAEDAPLTNLAQIAAHSRDQALSEQVHAAWYLVRWGDPEPNPGQLRFVRRLAEVLPVVFVVTAVPANLAGHPDQRAVQFARFIEAQLLPISPSNSVMLTNARIDIGDPVPLHGLAELASATFAVAPEAARRAQAAARLAQRQHRGRSIPLSSLRLRAPNWQQDALPLRAAARSYWSKFRHRGDG